MLAFAAAWFTSLLLVQAGLVYMVGTSYTVVCNFVKSFMIVYLWVFYAPQLVQTALQIASDVPVTADEESIRAVAIVYGCLDCTATILNTKALYFSTLLHHLFVIGTSVGFCVMLLEFPCANIISWYLIWSLAAVIPNYAVSEVKYAIQCKRPFPRPVVVYATINYIFTLGCNWIGCLVLIPRMFKSETPLRFALGCLITAGWVYDDTLFVLTLRRWSQASLLTNKLQ